MNSVSLIGNLAKDPELRYTTGQNQTAVGRFTVAVEDGYGDKKRVAWIPVLTFGKVAENCEKYLHKGSKVGISGKLQTGSYEKDGKKVYTWEVLANSVEFLTTREVTEVAKEDLPPADLNEQMSCPGAVVDDDIPF